MSELWATIATARRPDGSTKIMVRTEHDAAAKPGEFVLPSLAAADFHDNGCGWSWLGRHERARVFVTEYARHFALEGPRIRLEAPK